MKKSLTILAIVLLLAGCEEQGPYKIANPWDYFVLYVTFRHAPHDPKVMYRDLLYKAISGHCSPPRADCMECQLTALGKEIYSRLSKDEIYFLMPIVKFRFVKIPPFILAEYILNKFGNEYGGRIQNIISDPEISAFLEQIKYDSGKNKQNAISGLQVVDFIKKYDKDYENEMKRLSNRFEMDYLDFINEKELRPHQKINPKHALAFSYIALLIRDKKATLAYSLEGVVYLYDFYHYMDEWPKLSINDAYKDIAAEANITKVFGTLSDDILQALSESDKKYLSETNEAIIMEYLLAESRGLADPLRNRPRLIGAPWSINPIIDQGMIDYFEKKYYLRVGPYISPHMKKMGYHRLNPMEVNWFCYELGCAFAAKKLKNASYSIEECLKMFDAYFFTRIRNRLDAEANQSGGAA